MHAPGVPSSYICIPRGNTMSIPCALHKCVSMSYFFAIPPWQEAAILSKDTCTGLVPMCIFSNLIQRVLGSHHLLFEYVLDMPDHLLQEDWDNTMRPNPHTIWRSIFLEWCNALYGFNPRTRNHQCLVQPFSNLRHVGCTTSPMSSNESPLTNHRSTYMHHTSLPLAIKIGLFHTSLVSSRPL